MVSATAAQVSTPVDPAHDWKPQPLAFELIRELLATFLARNQEAQLLADAMRTKAGTRFIDWVDHIRVPFSAPLHQRLLSTGFVHKPVEGATARYVHEGAILPDVLLDDADATLRVCIKTDDVAAFLAAWHIAPWVKIEGAPFAAMRTAPAFIAPGAELWVIERHGYKGYCFAEAPTPLPELVAHHLDQFCRRKRDWPTDDEGFAHARALIDAAISDLGRDRACDLFFESERRYWMRRNRAAQVQYARQAKLGLGWANHDHHTYRSSRENFTRLIACLERLGVRCRERFHAGRDAGWGAQVMESPTTGIVCVCDVDLTDGEVRTDFAHEPLPPTPQLGTIGLWAGLHGEAFLQAGMHHLECTFDWHALREQLEAEAGIKTMDPFTTFSFLRQAFTEGERWSVPFARLERLVQRSLLTQDQADHFANHGALGSHLENLERNDGYKGFNKDGISDIITRTDARKHR